MARITVQAMGERRFHVRVDAAGDTGHEYDVDVPEALAGRLGARPAEIARATLAFLLDREPPSAILPSFGCEVVPRYFPEYEAELPAYLQGPGGQRRTMPDRSG